MVEEISGTAADTKPQSAADESDIHSKATSDLGLLPRLIDVASEVEPSETSKFEKMFNEMIDATSDNAFNRELEASENWFAALSEAEQSAILYTLFTQVNQGQTRFFLALLQYMVNHNVCNNDKKEACKEQSEQAKQRFPAGAPFTATPCKNTLYNSANVFPDTPLTSEAHSIDKSKAFFNGMITPASGNKPTCRDRRPCLNFADGKENLPAQTRSGRPIYDYSHEHAIPSGQAYPSFGVDPSLYYSASQNYWSTLNAGNTPAASRIVSNGNETFFLTPINNSASRAQAWHARSSTGKSSMSSRDSARNSASRTSHSTPMSVGSSNSSLPQSSESAGSLYSQAQELFAYDDYGGLVNLSSVSTPMFGKTPYSVRRRVGSGSKLVTPIRTSLGFSSPIMPSPLTPGSTDGSDKNLIKTRQYALQQAAANNVSGWLRGLRLHKYTTNLSSYSIDEIKCMDDVKLEKVGISALGARRKILKFFENVRDSNESLELTMQPNEDQVEKSGDEKLLSVLAESNKSFAEPLAEGDKVHRSANEEQATILKTPTRKTIFAGKTWLQSASAGKENSKKENPWSNNEGAKSKRASV